MNQKTDKLMLFAVAASGFTSCGLFTRVYTGSDYWGVLGGLVGVLAFAATMFSDWRTR